MQYQGQAPLQQRFETRLKRIIKPSRGSEWLEFEDKSKLFNDITELRRQLTFKPLEYQEPRRSERNRR